MKYFIILLLLLFSLQCDSVTDTDTNESTIDIEDAKISLWRQDEYNDLYRQFLNANMTTTEAFDSLIVIMNQDSIVDNIHKNNNSIVIQYKCKIRCGILVDTMLTVDTILTRKVKQIQEKQVTIKPTLNEKTIILAPLYKSIQNLKLNIYDVAAEGIIEKFKDCLPRIGYDEPKILENTNANINSFTNLDDYGIIFIYTHGVIITSVENNQVKDIYLMTGEYLNGSNDYENIKKYLDNNGKAFTFMYRINVDKNGNIINDGTGAEGIKTFICINSEYFKEKNNFKEDKTLIYASVCLITDTISSWHSNIESYFMGLNDSVHSMHAAGYAISMIDSLTNSDKDTPMTVGEWFNSTSKVNFLGWEAKTDSISCTKGLNLALWKKDSIEVENVVDADGNIYETVKIGNQIWTVDNLKTTKYNDGTSILHLTDLGAWENNTSGAYSYYGNTTSSFEKETFGVLYNWYAVNSGKLAPKGWHIPSDSEWLELQEYLIANGYNWDKSIEGNKIAKSISSKDYWMTSEDPGEVGYNPSENNETGFSALAGGYRASTGYFFNSSSGYWWSSTDSLSHAYRYYIKYNHEDLIRKSATKGCGMSIKLVKD